ncbi:hypothetical protein SCLCIDRAFT_134636, partial [Scleroderma citrinum Foug A]
SKGTADPIDKPSSEKVTWRKAPAWWTAEEEHVFVLYLEQQAAAARDGANFTKKHFIGTAQHLKDTIPVQQGGEKTFSTCHSKWTHLKENYYTVVDLKSASGMSWSDTNGAGMEKLDAVWKTYVKV